MSTSRYVQITPYCLVEYSYTSSTAPEDYSFDFMRIVNEQTGQVHLMNVDSADSTTRNVRERSAVQISNGIWVDTDKDQIPNFLDYQTGISVTTITAGNCPYDSCRVHLLAGYNFEGIDGIMINIHADERSGKTLVLSNIVFLKTSDFFDYNPRPVLLGDKMYDRYVTVKIPSAKLNNDIYYSLEGNPTQSATFIAKATSNNMGLLRGNPLKINVIEIKSTTVLEVGAADYNQYHIGATSTVAINQADEFALLGAVIQESTGGDYYEYFATWDGGFIEDYIGLTSGMPGFDYVVIHELRVLEQISSLYTQTAFFQSIQEINFEDPNLFRPIILNSSAVSFTIEYVMRLYNKANSQQLIRTASITNYNVNKWGREISKIELLNTDTPYRIYNKVVAGPSLPLTTFLNNDLPVSASGKTAREVITKMVPSFFDRSMVTVQADTINLDANGQMALQASSDTQPVYGQGDATIVLSPFDNFFKFTLLKTDVTAGNKPVPLDLGQNAKYYIVFIDNDGNKKRYVNMTDAKLGDPQAGDLIFKIPSTEANTILGFTNKQFWLSSMFEDTGAETSIYYGEFIKVDEMDKKRDRENLAESRSKAKSALDARIAELEKKLTDTQIALDNATSMTNSTSISTGIDAKDIGQTMTKDGVKIPSGLKEETISQLVNTVPGLNNTIPKENKNSVVSSIKPKVLPKILKKKV